ncbi:hypothetical protein [Lentibacillus sp.]|uniref:hypothetical protein n=1 Tax=Lentibacillus sp. TaxID=1925746 RepID=UPI002B4B1964|nr:hypothetical protein [Lentibacillus sp.]HLS09427.1 hypothetical protein [Lentibacillus sp.]
MYILKVAHTLAGNNRSFLSRLNGQVSHKRDVLEKEIRFFSCDVSLLNRSLSCHIVGTGTSCTSKSPL